MPRRPEPELMDLPDEADAYARADFSQVNQAFVDRLVELIGPRRPARLLDLGTGPADIPILLAAELRRRWPDAAFHIIAVDGAPAMIDLAAGRVLAAGMGGIIEPLLADAKATGLRTHSFDVIFSNSILHHVADAEAFWREVRRLAAPGAVIFLRDLARPDSEAVAVDIVRRHAGNETQLLQDEYFRSLLAAYTPHEVRRQLDAASLGQLDVRMVTDRHLDVTGYTA